MTVSELRHKLFEIENQDAEVHLGAAGDEIRPKIVDIKVNEDNDIIFLIKE